MSRAKKFTRSLISGYLLLGANVLYTFASIPIALAYLSKEELGLWGVVMQVAGYLVLIDLGMAGSISRILIDHKDSAATETYGSIIKTGALVLLVQGAIIAVAGAVICIWLPGIFNVPEAYRHTFQILIAGHCGVLGLFFAGRMFNHVLQAHQRYDAMNYSQIGGLFVNLGAMWLAFQAGWSLYSLLAGYSASVVFSTLFTLAATLRFRLLPFGPGSGHTNSRTFRELFAYGREIFLLSVGWQLVNASQMIVIGRMLGFDAAGVWSIATKPFALAQQVVYRVLDYASAGLAEMMVRQEKERLLIRFRDIVTLSASLAVWVALSVSLCNHDFLALWTKKRVAWGSSTDWLMGAMVITYSVTRCYTGFIGLTKDIRFMKYVYLLEGLIFIGASVLAARVWGINGIISSAIVTDLLSSGLYGLFRTEEYFTRNVRSLFAWFRGPIRLLLFLCAAFAATAWATSALNSPIRLAVRIAVALSVGLTFFWQFGLGASLRAEVTQLLARSLASVRESLNRNSRLGLLS
jgi:O-antigen/teichoic acid export membrane protein